MSAFVNPAPFDRAAVDPGAAEALCSGCDPERLRRLVRRIAGKDHGAFAELFERCAGPVLRTLHFQVPNRHRIASVLAGTFVEVWWLAGGHVDPDSDIPAWIEEIVRRRVAESRSPASSDGEVCGALWAQGIEVELARLLRRHPAATNSPWPPYTPALPCTPSPAPCGGEDGARLCARSG